MTDFERLPEHRLHDLSDEALVEYAAAAHTAGDTVAERAALGYLAYAWEPTIRAKVRLKVPSQDHDDVILAIQESLIRSSFEGKVIGQFGAFLRTITQRRIADYHRERERRHDPDSIDTGWEDGDEPEITPIAADETAAADLLAVVEKVLADRSPLHQKVIRLYGPEVVGFLNMTAAEVKEAIDGDDTEDTVSIDNVAQIWSRFRRDLMAELGDG